MLFFFFFLFFLRFRFLLLFGLKKVSKKDCQIDEGKAS